MVKSIQVTQLLSIFTMLYVMDYTVHISTIFIMYLVYCMQLFNAVKRYYIVPTGLCAIHMEIMRYMQNKLFFKIIAICAKIEL